MKAASPASDKQLYQKSLSPDDRGRAVFLYLAPVSGGNSLCNHLMNDAAAVITATIIPEILQQFYENPSKLSKIAI